MKRIVFLCGTQTATLVKNKTEERGESRWSVSCDVPARGPPPSRHDSLREEKGRAAHSTTSPSGDIFVIYCVPDIWESDKHSYS